MEVEIFEIEQFIRHLLDKEIPLAVAQLFQLSDLFGAKLARLQETWPRIPVERRRQAIGFMSEIAETNFEVNFEAVFYLGLNDTDGEVRARSIEGLWESEDTNLIEPLLEMAQNDLSERARTAAIAGLGRFVLIGELDQIPPWRQEMIEKVLLALVRSTGESLQVRRRAVEALSFSSRKEVTGIIENAYYHQARCMRVAAIYAMGRNLDPNWEPLLLNELQSDDSECRYEAVRACGELELVAAIPRLAELLTDQDREIQESSILALGQIGGQQAQHILETYYKVADPDDEALREAIEDALNDLSVASGTTQFTLYDYTPDIEDQIPGWGDEWISGVLDGKDNEAALDDFDIN